MSGNKSGFSGSQQLRGLMVLLLNKTNKILNTLLAKSKFIAERFVSAGNVCLNVQWSYLGPDSIYKDTVLPV